MVSEGIVKLCFLKVNHQRIAVQYNFVYQNRCHYYQSGFEQSWGRFGPGIVLMYYSIRNAIQQKMKEYDFLPGDEAYKFKWSNAVRQSYTYTFFNTSAKSNLYRHLLLLAEKAKTTLKKHLNRREFHYLRQMRIGSFF
jgi:CelD/BcsL family acetyltransferase involved in cellulose biosynthesis